MSSNPITIQGGPTLPNIAYYNSDKNDTTRNSYNNLTTNLQNSCSITSSASGIYSDPSIIPSEYIPLNQTISGLDIPYYLAKAGTLMSSTNADGSSNTNNLPNIVESNITNGTQNNIVNQIQYLLCQLEQTRNQEYNPDFFNLISNGPNIKEMFHKYSNLKPFLILIFIITIYLLVSGFFSSFDLGANIFHIIYDSNDLGYEYWIGLLLGIICPIVTLCIIYSKLVCKNLSDLEKYEITTNEYGVKNQIPSDLKNFDFMTLVLFIFLIYAFIAVLFTIKKNVPNVIYSSIFVGIIMFILSLFIYVFYAYIPFFNTADDKNIMSTEQEKLRLFIDQQTSVSEISTNQYENGKMKQAFFITFIVIIILTILFFIVNGKREIIDGFLSSSAILALPMLWVFNFIIGINYFYVYPMLFIVLRFIRYGIMSILYILSEKKDSLRDSFSSDLVEQMEDFKNYSPNWGLIGVDELKLLLNAMGYENILSKSILSNNGYNVSQNKYVSSGFLNFFVHFIVSKDMDSNKNGIAYSFMLIVVTILISVIILYGIVKIQSK
jgi:hypothetical protein